MTEGMNLIAVGLLGLSFLTGCERGPSVVDPPPNPNSHEASASGTAFRSSSSPNFDDEMLAIADQVSGFAGVYFEEDGEMVAMLKHPGRLGEVGPRLMEFIFRMTDSPRVRQDLAVSVSALGARPAQYDFRELHDWRQQVRSLIPTSPEMTMIDINASRNRIVVGVESEDDVPLLQEHLRGLAIPEDVVLVEVVGRFLPDASLSGTVRPVLGGVRVFVEGQCLKASLPCDCSLGFNVRRRLSSGAWDPDWYFTTAAHCTPQFGQVPSPAPKVGQPTLSSLVGAEHLDPPTFTSSQDSACPSGADCRRSDLALMKYNGTTGVGFARVAWPNLGSSTFSQSRWVVGVFPPFEGLSVHKVGKATGRTSGTVQVVCGDFPVASFVNDVDWLLCQGMATYHSGGGDSGGSVVRELSVADEVASVGTHVGRTGGPSDHAVFSTTSQFIAELDANSSGTFHLTTFSHPPPKVSISGPTTLPPNLLCTWTADVSSGVPPFSFLWSGILSGSGSGVSGVVNSSGWLFVEVSDRETHSGNSSVFVTVDPGAPAPPGCTE